MWTTTYLGVDNGRHRFERDGVAGDPLRFGWAVPDELNPPNRVWASTLRPCDGGDSIDAAIGYRAATSEEIAAGAAADPPVTIVRTVIFDFGPLARGEYVYDVQHAASADPTDDPSTVEGGKVIAHRQETT